MSRVRSALLLAFAAGCGGTEMPSVVHVTRGPADLSTTNGISLNGISLNGISLNGISLNGISLNGISLNGISLNGISLNGSTLSGIAGGKSVSGATLSGALLNGVLSNGGTLHLRVDAVAQDVAPNDDVTLYSVSYQGSSGAWYPLCGNDASGSAVPAVALAGTWDDSQGTSTGGDWSASSTQFTFGCRSAALGKCVELGYKPWATENGVSLRRYHQACTRMIRADYCGDGTPWTTNGRRVNLYDSIGVQSDTQNWLFEAEWTDAGARCISTMRVIDLKNVFGIVSKCVLLRTLPLFCGMKTDFRSGTLLMNEYQSMYLGL
jgi:ADYC domain